MLARVPHALHHEVARDRQLEAAVSDGPQAVRRARHGGRTSRYLSLPRLDSDGVHLYIRVHSAASIHALWRAKLTIPPCVQLRLPCQITSQPSPPASRTSVPTSLRSLHNLSALALSQRKASDQTRLSLLVRVRAVRFSAFPPAAIKPRRSSCSPTFQFSVLSDCTRAPPSLS